MSEISWEEVNKAKQLIADYFRQIQTDIDNGYMYDLMDSDKMLYLILKEKGY